MHTKANPKQFARRMILIHLIIYASFAIIIQKLWFLQIEQGTHYKELAVKNRIRSVHLPAPRGKIFDRNGNILVDNRPRFDLIATIEDVSEPESTSKIISAILNIPDKEIWKRLLDKKSHLPFEPSVIYTDLSMKNVVKLSEKFYLMPGVDMRILPVRYYVHGETACHLLGYTGRLNEKEINALKDKGYNPSDEIGKTGIEETYESYLRGIPGGRQIQINSLGHLDKVIGEKSPIKGNDVYLTIDMNLQKIAAEALGEKSGAVIVMEVDTGNILTLLSQPGFNPNFFTTGHSAKINNYFVDDTFPLLNRAITSEYSPGSIFKPIVALAAQKEGFATDQTSFFCSGSFKLKNTIFKCWRKWGHGETNLIKSLEQSCNVFYYNLGKEMNYQAIVEESKKFGLGKKTEIPILGEKNGLVPSGEWKKQRFKDKSQQKWHLGDSINFSIGQGYLLVTPIQMTCMTAALASRGHLPQPKLLQKVLTPDGKILFEPEPEKPKDLLIPQDHLEKVLTGMYQVVNARHGTGRKALLKNCDVKIAGKTGTAQVKTKKGEIKNAWFICFAPFDKPQIAMTILVEDTESGGQNAAPVAQKILAAYFNIDLPEEKNETEEEKEVTITTDMDDEEVIEVLVAEEEKQKTVASNENRE